MSISPEEMSSSSANGNSSSSGSSLDPSTRMKLLIESSRSIDIDRNIPIARYFKSGKELLKTASNCKESGDIEKAFILYLRYTSLFIEKLVRHPEWNKADKEEKELVKKECNNILDLAENLKTQIKQKYEKEYEQSRIKRDITDKTDDMVDCSGNGTNKSIGIDEIDQKFDFTSSPNDEDNKDSSNMSNLFNIEELRRSLTSTRKD